MKLLICILLSMSFSAFADYTTFDCNKSFTPESLTHFYENDGPPELKDSIGFQNLSGDLELILNNVYHTLDEKNVTISEDYSTYTVRTGVRRGYQRVGKDYVFTMGNEDYDGKLEIFIVGGIVGRMKMIEMNCYLSID